jgi:hypothetical protein
MNRLALAGATLAVLVCAAVAFAASPSPSSSPLPSGSPSASILPVASGSPAASPYVAPGASPAASPSASPATSSGSATTSSQKSQPTTWTSDVSPVDISGTATVTKRPDGTGQLTLQLTGMVNEQNWIVDVDPGTIQHPNDGVDIAYKTGNDVMKVAPDKIQVNLTKDEMDAFTKAISNNGVTIFVSDGQRLSAATISGTQQ